MKEQVCTFVGVGTALVDIKVIDPIQALPQTQQEVPEFLSKHSEIYKNAGGSMATVMSVLADLSPSSNVHFLQRIGMDDNGAFYTQHTPQELISGIQVDIDKPTGVCVFAIDKGGQKIDQWPEVTFYGASDELEIPKGTGSSGDIFITNINAYKRFSRKGQIVEALHEVANNEKVFVLRLSGIQHGTDEIFDKKELDSLVASFPKPPDIIFANAVEIKHVSGIYNTYEATKKAFPDARLLSVTNGADGSLVRFENTILKIPPEPISQQNVVDTTGAGDAYMGVMLASLFTRSYGEWTPDFITSCAEIGTYAATLVIQSLDSRLTELQLADIGGRIRLMGVKFAVEKELEQIKEVREKRYYL